MTVTSGFFDAKVNSTTGEYDRVYNAAQMSELFEGIITDGVFKNVGDAFAVNVGTGMQVTVGTGRAWFQNVWIKNDAKITKNVPASDATYTRTDAICIKIDKINRGADIVYKKGTPSALAPQPEYSRTEYVGEYPICLIRVGAGMSAINSNAITYQVGIRSDVPFVAAPTVSFDGAKWYSEFERQWKNFINGAVTTDPKKFTPITNAQIDQYFKDAVNGTSSGGTRSGGTGGVAGGGSIKG